MNKSPERTDATKEALRAAFWKLYTIKPINRITIKAITDAAGYNRGTFYRYYLDVYDILDEIETEILCQFDTRFAQISEQATAMDMLSIIKHTLTPCQIYNSYLAVLLGANGDMRFQTQLKDKAKALLSEQITKRYGKLEGDGEYCLEFCVSGLLSCTQMWYERGQDVDIHDYISTMYRILAEPLGIFSDDLKSDMSEKLMERRLKL
ncbi:MAG: TetR/AcrR family transcriptional regulator [Oscillospiraceae bacterium]